ncbi:hypothetical protein MWF98_08975 [Fusobacterium necrophorum]|uniref:hypothetical protein n=1 Tax=Fusobacterium necrophorum TaxID=859 RepID=UPI0001BC456B|nr:hypothetical protein [Fusobacterium necrophorum]EGR54002.1 hypothetical protein FSEG_02144 [Fusobacterium necrophorum D12]MDK4504343.1 hypothetical protein [Fusobacterium necrophorum]
MKDKIWNVAGFFFVLFIFMSFFYICMADQPYPNWFVKVWAFMIGIGIGALICWGDEIL